MAGNAICVDDGATGAGAGAGAAAAGGLAGASSPRPVTGAGSAFAGRFAKNIVAHVGHFMRAPCGGTASLRTR